MHTSVVERHHGTSRWRQQRQGRQTLAFSKAPRSPRWRRGRAVGLANFYRAPRSFADEARGMFLSAEPGKGSNAPRPSLVHWGMVALPGLGGLR